MTETITITPPPEADNPDVKRIAENALLVAEQYVGYQVTNADEYTAGAEHLKGIKSALKLVENERFKITRPMDAAKKAVMQFFGSFESQLKNAENVVKRGLVAYQNEQDRIAREQRRKAEERQRKEEEKLRKQAEAAREKGNETRAEILEDRADTKAAAPAEPPAVTVPKVSGVSTRTVWKFEITEPSKVPDEYKTIDEKKIGGVVRALKGDTNIPGVRVYSEKQMAAGAR